MTIASEIERVQTNIANAYVALEGKGATMPEARNSANLATTIESVSGGGGETVVAKATTGTRLANVGDKVFLNTIESEQVYNPDFLERYVSVLLHRNSKLKLFYATKYCSNSSAVSTDLYVYDFSDPANIKLKSKLSNVLSVKLYGQNFTTVAPPSFSEKFNCFVVGNVLYYFDDENGDLKGTSTVFSGYTSVSMSRYGASFVAKDSSGVITVGELSKDSAYNFSISNTETLDVSSTSGRVYVSNSGNVFLVYASSNNHVYKNNNGVLEKVGTLSGMTSTGWTGVVSEDEQEIYMFYNGDFRTVDAHSLTQKAQQDFTTASYSYPLWLDKDCIAFNYLGGFAQLRGGLLDEITYELTNSYGYGAFALDDAGDYFVCGRSSGDGMVVAKKNEEGLLVRTRTCRYASDTLSPPLNLTTLYTDSVQCYGGVVGDKVLKSGLVLTIGADGYSAATGAPVSAARGPIFYMSDLSTYCFSNCYGTSSSNIIFSDGATESISSHQSGSMNVEYNMYKTSSKYVPYEIVNGQRVQYTQVNEVSGTSNYVSVIIGDYIFHDANSNSGVYVGTVDRVNKTITWDTSGRRNVGYPSSRLINMVLPGQKYLFTFPSSAGALSVSNISLLSFDASTQNFTSVSLPSVITENISTFISFTITPAGDVVIGSVSSFYVFSWDGENLDSFYLKEIIQSPLSANYDSPVLFSSELLVFNSGIYRRTPAGTLIAEKWRANALFEDTLTGFVEETVDANNNLKVKTLTGV